jgi:hypothetical protein
MEPEKQKAESRIQAKTWRQENSKHREGKGTKEINCHSLFVVFVCFCEKSLVSGFGALGWGDCA